MIGLYVQNEVVDSSSDFTQSPLEYEHSFYHTLG